MPKVLGNDGGERVSLALQQEIAGHVTSVRSAIQSGSPDQMRNAMQSLEASMQRFGEAVYAWSGVQGGSDRSRDDMVDGEFLEI